VLRLQNDDASSSLRLAGSFVWTGNDGHSDLGLPSALTTVTDCKSFAPGTGELEA
jgi:hypothetical protein